MAISKETPLYDLAKVFKSAMDNGRMPKRSGRLIQELGQSLRPDSEEYASFFKWADDAKSHKLHQIFPASLLVHERSNDIELDSEIENFWAGDKVYVSQVKGGLREIGQFKNYSFRAPKVRDLPPQRLSFMIELIKAAGYKGWVVLLDEIELVAQYSLLQRGRSYAELSRWMGRAVGEAYPGLVVVGTVTADFAAEVISPGGSKIDRDKAGAKLEQGPRYQHLVPLVEEGMQMLELGCIPLNPANGRRRSGDHGKTAENLFNSLRLGRSKPFPSPERGGAGYQNRMRYRVRSFNQRMGPAQALPGLQSRNGRARISPHLRRESRP